MRDMLIELIGSFPTFGDRKLSDKWMPEAVERLADHLLAEGCILPPCKVGDTVYAIDTYNMEVVEWSFILRMIDSIGKTVFLTKEQAEKSLAERREG